MGKRLSSLLLCLLCSCGPMQAPDPSVIDSEFIPYLNEYKLDKHLYLGHSKIRKMDIVFFSLSYPTSGKCLVRNDERIIQIDPYVWYSLSNEDRMVLFYHEMGHCDLNILHHVSDHTIMNAIFMSGLFNTNPDYYKQLLFIEGK